MKAWRPGGRSGTVICRYKLVPGTATVRLLPPQ